MNRPTPLEQEVGEILEQVVLNNQVDLPSLKQTRVFYENIESAQTQLLTKIQEYVEDIEVQARYDFATEMKRVIDKGFMGATDMDMVNAYLEGAIKTLVPQLRAESNNEKS